MPVRNFDLLTLGTGFPPSLNTTLPATDIGIDETADGFGFSMDTDGLLAKGTIPTGTARVVTQKTINAVVYRWFYNRLWGGVGSTSLTYGAPDYFDDYYAQRFGKIPFDEDGSEIVEIVAFGADSLCIAKATGSYIVSNATDTRALLPRTDIIQELTVSNAARITELDGVIYVSNTKGLFSYFQGVTTELTRPVRNDSNFTSLFANKTLTVDYTKKRIIAGTFVYEVETKKILRYVSSTFRYTSKQFHLPDYAVFAVQSVDFNALRTNTDNGWIEYQIKIEDNDWSEGGRTDFSGEPGTFTLVQEAIAGDDARGTHRFQFRITDMSSNLRIRGIELVLTGFKRESYST